MTPALRSHSLAALLALMLIPAVATAAAVTWDESIDGDLEPVAPAFALGTGVNTFSGTASAFIAGQPNDLDSFLFDLAPGQRLTRVVLSFGNVQHSPTTAYVVADYSVTSPAVTVFYTPTENLFLYHPAGTPTASPASLFEGALPLGAGTYRLTTGLGGGDPGGEFAFSYDYTLAMTVVPLPPAAALLLAPLAMAARRRAH